MPCVSWLSYILLKIRSHHSRKSIISQNPTPHNSHPRRAIQTAFESFFRPGTSGKLWCVIDAVRRNVESTMETRHYIRDIPHIRRSTTQSALLAGSIENGAVAHGVHDSRVAITDRLVGSHIQIRRLPRFQVLATALFSINGVYTHHVYSTVHPVAVAAASKHLITFSVNGLRVFTVSDRI